MGETIRIRTTPNGSDKYLKVKIEQDFDFIEVLSLNISQQNAYQSFCSDYGAIVGRVIINSGFGVPNVKVSVFVPLDDIDSSDPHISGLYPYKAVTDVNSDGVRYNLLPSISDSNDPCYTAIGTFPTKREILDNDDMLYVYKKYYQFTTTTNYAGDFMLFGVPLGNHVVHVDMDISNIGIASQKPYDLMAQGAPASMFYSTTKFKSNTNINSLPQIKSANASVNVQPFWGDLNNCQVGINRLDFDMNYNITPAAMFMGSIFGDGGKHSIDKRCIPRRKTGVMCEQETSSGTIEMIRKTIDNQVESFDVNGGQLIDNDGVWAYQIPMNLDYMVTDEFGQLIPSSDSNIGIATRSRVRFRIGMNQTGDIGRLRTRAHYLVPNNPATPSNIDYSFDETTNDANFTDLHWNKIYTVKNFIPKYNPSNVLFGKNKYLGIKDVDKCNNFNKFPYNTANTEGTTFNQVIFTIVCLLNTFIAIISSLFNALLSAIANIGFSALGIDFHPFRGLCDKMIGLTCNVDDNPKKYYPGAFGDCSAGNNSIQDFTDCIATSLAVNLEIYQMDFYNDWVNGSLYAYLLKYKQKHNGTAKYCDADCYEDNNSCIEGEVSFSSPDLINNSEPDMSPKASINEGLIRKVDGILYYSPMTNFSGGKKLFATDITNLGAVFECDWQGYPKIIDLLSPTSYKLPPIVYENTSIGLLNYLESGIFSLDDKTGLFFNATCGGVSKNANNDLNIKRQCELGVDIPETSGSTLITEIKIGEIYDTSDSLEVTNSIHKYIRDAYTLLNVFGSSNNIFPTSLIPTLSATTNGTSFGVNGFRNNGSLYHKFSNYNNLSGGSYYTYFGLIAGKTAYDKLINKYFTKCSSNINDNFSIVVNTFPSSSLTASDGSFEFYFTNGTAPFTTIIEGTSINNIISTKPSQSQIVSRLTDGTYKIIATDALGTVVTRSVNVSGPQRLTLFLDIISQPSSSTNKNGQLKISYLSGGTIPYNLSFSSNGVVTNHTNVLQGNLLTGFGAGDYIATITDSSTAKQTEQLSFTLTPPPPLTLTINSFDNLTTSGCTANGSVLSNITGGNPPYTLNLIGKNYNTTGLYGNITFDNLFGGNYIMKVTDAANTLVQANVTIKGPAPLEFIGTAHTQTTGGGKAGPAKTFRYISELGLVSGGVPTGTFRVGGGKGGGKLYDTYDFSPAPYALNNVDGNPGWESYPTSGITITVTDKNGCSLTKTFI